VPRGHSRSPAFLVICVALALAGTAAAMGYRYIFTSPVQPNRAPAVTASHELNKIPLTLTRPRGKDDPDITGSIQSLIGNEQRSADRKAPKVALSSIPPRASAPSAPTAPAGAPQTLPNSKDAPGATAASGPRGSDATDSTAAPRRTHLAALAALASADVSRTAAATSPVLGNGYAVQVASERSKSRAKAAFRTLQRKIL
jgi:hypothetical protein